MYCSQPTAASASALRCRRCAYFQGRTSRGVRGITLADKDHVISLSILSHVEVTAEERAAYHKRASAVRRGVGDEEVPAAAEAEEAVGAIELGEKRYVELSAAEQFVLTVSERGYGKRSSSYEYRTTGRGGKGIVAMSLYPRKRPARSSGSFPVEEADQIMLVTDQGKLIRTPVSGIRIAGRSTQGVIVLNTAEDERVVSVERLSEEGEEDRGTLRTVQLLINALRQQQASPPSRCKPRRFASVSGVAPELSARLTFALASISAFNVAICRLPPSPSTINSMTAVQPRLLT